MKTEFLLTEFPMDESDILVEFVGETIIEVTDDGGNVCTLTPQKKDFLIHKIREAKNANEDTSKRKATANDN